MIRKIKDMILNTFVARSEFEVEARYLRDKIMELEKRNKELEDIILSFGNDHQKIAELYKTVANKISE